MEERVKNFKDLKVWQKAYQLSLLTYQVTKDYPPNELYGMVTQMRMAAVSVVSNIAEGYSRKGRMEYIQFLSIAYGSLAEIETQILLSSDLKYINKEASTQLINLKDEIGGMLYRLMQKLSPSFRQKEGG